MEPTVLEETQKSLFDLSGKEFNINWVDEKQPLFVANNPLHWKAHKLQILIARLDRQADRNGAQFNSANYIAAVNELEKCMIAIQEGATDDVLGQNQVAESGDGSTAPAVGEGNSAGMDTRVSADNPTAR